MDGAWLHPKHEKVRSSQASATLVFNGGHEGCSDVHAQMNGRRCEFDGKMSWVSFRGRWLAYARANMLNWGGRYVQMAASSGPDALGPYGKFGTIDIEGYSAKGPGNIYYGAVTHNPVDSATLVGLFPINEGRPGQVNANGDTYIGMALTCDGVHFSQLTKLIASQGREGRTYDQPVDGLVLRGDTVYLYVHLDVEHISPEADRKSRIEQYAFKSGRLEAITRGVRSSLRGCPALPA